MSVPDNYDEFCHWVVESVSAYREAAHFTVEQLVWSEAFQNLSEAQKRIPHGHANWEIRDFYGWAIAGTIPFLTQGRIESYAEFKNLMIDIFGAKCSEHLPAIFFAAALSPGIAEDLRRDLLASLA